MVSTSVFETVYIGSIPVKCSIQPARVSEGKEVSYNGYYRRLPNDLFQFDSGYFQFFSWGFSFLVSFSKKKKDLKVTHLFNIFH